MTFPTSHGGKFTARFNPKRTDDLQDDARANVGRVMEFRFGWIMEDADPFPGEAAYIPTDLSMGWVPARDLEPVS